MRYNLKLNFKGLYFYLMVSQTQIIKGLCSLIERNNTDIRKSKHIVLWDLEDCTLKEVKTCLEKQQYKYGLSDIFIFSDYPRSYRAICLTQINFSTLLKIILENKYIDYNFFYWTVRRSKATIRYGDKKERPENRIVDILKSDIPYKLPEKFIFVEYETGLDKIGHTLEILKT